MKYRRSDVDYAVQSNSAGTEFSPAYHMGFDENGEEAYLRDLHDIPTQDLIQSFAESTDLSAALKRYMEGDSTALGDPAGSFFADVSEMPKTLAEAFALSRSVEQKWYALPDSLRAFYGNRISDFLSDLDAGKVHVLENVVPLEEVKSNES